MTQIFFRAISFAELSDLRRSGRFLAGPNSCEGKHLALAPEHARAWGTALGGAFMVIRIWIPDEDCADLHRWEQLDGIGPAAFATIEQLSRARYAEEIEHD